MITGMVVIGIVAVIALAWIELREQANIERNQQERAKAAEEQENYIAHVRAKYMKRGLPMNFRRRIDFAGEKPLQGAELEQVKREIIKA